MPLYYLVTKQLSGFCSHIPSERAYYKMPQHPVWIKKQQPVEVKLLVMMVPHWLDGREELRCLDEDESTHFRGLTFNYSPVYKIITVAVSASVSEFQTFHSLMMKCCERGARCSSKRQHCSLTLSDTAFSTFTSTDICTKTDSSDTSTSCCFCWHTDWHFNC